MIDHTEPAAPKARITATSALLLTGVVLGWTFVAYLSVTLSTPRLMPSDQVDPWPPANVAYAMVLIYLPVAAAAMATVTTRSSNNWRKGLVHIGAMLAVLTFLLAFAFG